MMQSLANNGSVPANGSLPAGGDGGAFELHRTRHLIDCALFGKWQEGAKRTHEAELERAFARDLEAARVHWERQSEVERLAVAIEIEILGPSPDTYPCPGCKAPFEYVSGCMALTDRRGCGRSFCGFCFTLSDAREAHDHSRVCRFNTVNPGNYDLLANGNQVAVFREVQRLRQIRELSPRFASVAASLREKLYARLCNQLEARKIAKSDCLAQ